MSDDDASMIDEIIANGNKEYGEADFSARSNHIVGLGRDVKEVRQAIAGLGSDVAHHVISKLFDDPDEAERIMGQRGLGMATELGRYAAKVSQDLKKAAAKPKEAPKPPAEPDLDSPDLNMRSYSERRVADRKAAKEAKKNYMPSKTDVYDTALSMKDYDALRRKAEAEHRQSGIRNIKLPR